MTCPAATGPCSLPATGSCEPVKTVDPGIPILTDVTVVGQGTHFLVSWDTSTSYPDQIVRMYFRNIRTSEKNTTVTEARNTGVLSSGVFSYEDLTEVWLRAETSTNVTEWMKTLLDLGQLDFSDPNNSFFIGVV